MEKKNIPPKRIVDIVFLSLITLTVKIPATAVIIDFMNVRRGYYDRSGLDGLFYFIVMILAIYSLIIEANLWFDIRYFSLEATKKRTYKTVFHIMATSLLLPAAIGILTVFVSYDYYLEYATYALWAFFALTRLLHFVFYCVKGS